MLGHPLARRLGRIAEWSPAARLLFADVLLFSVVVVWAVVTQPTQRFNGAPMGDEPKYLRYCETVSAQSLHHARFLISQNPGKNHASVNRKLSRPAWYRCDQQLAEEICCDDIELS